MVVLKIIFAMTWVGWSCAYAEEPTTWWSLQSLRHQRFESFNSAVAHFPKDLRSNVLANFATESPQYASFAAPRTILYSENANLLVAIGGCRYGIPSSNLIEVAEFNPLADKYIPHLVQYIPSEGRLAFVENVNTVFSKGHPRHCARCHGEDFRPLFDSYNLWPRSYGSGFLDALEPDSPERKRWDIFFNNERKTGYYAHLNGLELSYAALRMANIRLVHLLNTNNERRIVRQIRDNPMVFKYAREIFSLFAARSGTLRPSDYFSSELRNEFEEKMPEIMREVSKASQENFLKKTEAYYSLVDRSSQAHFQDNFDSYEVRIYSGLKFFMNKAGLSMDEWPMTLEKGTYSFVGPLHPWEHMAYEFHRQILAPNFPSVARDFKFTHFNYETTSMDQSLTISLPAVKLAVENQVALNRLISDMLEESAVAECSRLLH